MTTYWAIAIGINQYRCFQPLMYGQRDAQALWSYWVSEGRFPTEQCWLLTDASTSQDSESLVPDRDTIESTIEAVCRQLHPDDVLWCFFSGYGVRFQGHDYLMPIEGDPTQIALTGIPIESLLSTLRSAPTQNVVLVLDMNRSQGAVEGEGAGQETIALANQLGISTLLSCHPDQFSYETLALRQGLFTAAVLEGLRFQGCATVGQLAAYVGDRLPELSEHHCRPRQDSIAVIPIAQQHLLLVPEQAVILAGVPYAPVETGSAIGGGASDRKTYPNQVPRPPISSGSIDSGKHDPNGRGYPLQPDAKRSVVNPPPLDKPATDSSSAEETDALFWRRWRPWILGAIAFLVLAVLLQNRDTFSNEPLPEPSPTPTVAPNPTNPATTNPGTTSSGELPEGSNLTAQTLNPPPSGTDVLPTEGADPTLVPDPISQPDPLTGGTANPAPLPNPTDSLPTSPLLQSVRSALQAQQYEQASRQLAQVPLEQRTGDYAALLQQTNQGLLVQARASLSRPRALSATNQASDFSTAIQLASRIQPNQPFYAEAQQDIDRWSQIILELARSRASQPNRGSALVAAQNYNTAIRAAGLVPPNRPQLHATAQQYIAQWSQTMMTMAQSRANEGRVDVAIRTAQLIPRNSPSYAAAEQAIAQWQAQLGYY